MLIWLSVQFVIYPMWLYNYFLESEMTSIVCGIAIIQFCWVHWCFTARRFACWDSSEFVQNIFDRPLSFKLLPWPKIQVSIFYKTNGLQEQANIFQFIHPTFVVLFYLQLCVTS